MTSNVFSQITDWSNLLLAYNKAAKSKRNTPCVAAFEYDLAENLLRLQHQLRSGQYRPGNYRHFYIHEPKRRRISAAPFSDRVIHHAVCNIIEPLFETSFIADSFANRVGKGNHRAINRFQVLSKRYSYCLRMDIVKYFESIDHALLHKRLSERINDQKAMRLIEHIINSGSDNRSQYFFPHDDLLSAVRPKGLPIGNLTSQFWSNCYLHPFDLFITRELSCKAYVRYVDDFALFADDKATLWRWKKQIIERLTDLRLRCHQHSAQVCPTRTGIPWLGMVVYPEHRRLKARKVRYATRNLRYRYRDWRMGKISFAELDASVKGWVAHAQHADSWAIREHVLGTLIVSDLAEVSD